MSRQSRQFVVFGRVQGVGFRSFVEKEARRIGIKGWVRNRDDGAVEVVAEGSSDQIEQLRGLLALGPSWSTVSRVEETEEAMLHYDSFSIRYR
jgi:acylphosphatase